MREHWGVAHQLVDNIRLRGVQRLSMMSNILSGVENLEGEAVKELTLGEETTYRLESPASTCAQKVRDIIQLWNLGFTEVDFFLELIDSPVELVTSIILEHIDQIFVAECPHIFLLLCVIESLDRIDHLVVEGHLGTLTPARDIDRVTEAWMVSFLNAITFRQNSLSDMIKVIDINGEPRHSF